MRTYQALEIGAIIALHTESWSLYRSYLQRGATLDSITVQAYLEAFEKVLTKPMEIKDKDKFCDMFERGETDKGWIRIGLRL